MRHALISVLAVRQPLGKTRKRELLLAHSIAEQRGVLDVQRNARPELVRETTGSTTKVENAGT